LSDLKAKVLDDSLTPFERLVILLEVLRSPEGCAWDRKQTHRSLLPYLIEEAYEVLETIESENYDELKEELGDLLCQIVFHAQLASERGDFHVNDSINGLIEKLINRHPHVFGDRNQLDPQQVRDQWEKIKVESGEKESALAGLPRSMPALTMAYRLGEKAGGLGFDWRRAEDVLSKIDEEVAEIKQEIFSQSENREERLKDEIGDVLFAVSSLARKLGVDPEAALRTSLTKFCERFGYMEAEIQGRGHSFDDYSLEELEEIWQKSKRRS
jgi:tetrapyrrole methylase family protein/MazG family protein